MSGRAVYTSLRDLVGPARSRLQRFLADDCTRVAVRDLETGTCLGGRLGELRDRSVLISTGAQLPTALAAIELDGVARRILLCPPDLPAAHLASVMADGDVDAIVSDGTGVVADDPDPDADPDAAPPPLRVPCGVRLAFEPSRHTRNVETEWVLFTSGTTGRPKMVQHSLQSLVGPLDDGMAVASDAVWSTFYDIRRYGGLQILLRALVGGGSMVLSSAAEPVAAFLVRAGMDGVTHISGTPSHWRRVLMSAATGRMAPRYVRLSGEIADQAILDSLHAAYPTAQVAHAFASTEAGVAFDVRDGLAGFPAALLEPGGANVEMRVEDGSLRIRSARTAARYLGDGVQLAADADGFIDTGDMVERRGDRYVFAGRKEGVINVGGQKVHPEEVEAVINRHPSVQLARVRGRPSAITGAIVMAELVLRPGAGGFETVRREVLASCRKALPPHKVPVTLRQVGSLDIDASGKLSRVTRRLPSPAQDAAGGGTQDLLRIGGALA